MPEAENGTGDSQPADDLRSALTSAFAENESAAAPEPKIEPKPAAVEAEAEVTGETPEPKETRERGADGKFAKKIEGEEVAAKPEGEAEVKPEDKKPEGIEPPVNWKAADKELFKKLPPDAQKIVIDRQKEMDADYTRKTQAIAAFKSRYDPVDKIFEPHREVMKQKGFTEASLVAAWSNVEQRLVKEPIEVIAGLVNGYKVDPAKLAARLGIKSAPAAEGEEAPAPVIQLPPDVQAKLARLDQIEQQVSGLTNQERIRKEQATAAGEARVMNEIEQFKSAKDDKGNLSHPHFEEVEAQMSHLALAAKQAGQSLPPLKELYETAVWANPSTREKLRTADTQQAEQKRKDEARAKAAAAKKASSSVTGAPGPGQATNQGRQSDKSLREQLEEAADEHASAA